MSNVGNLEVELSLRDEFTIALEKSIASLKRFSDEASKAADRAEKSFKDKAKAADESAQATEKDTKAAKENAQASDAEAKGADATTRGRKAKAKAATESAQATVADAKATQVNAGAADIEAKASEQAATSKRSKKKAAEDAARATGTDTTASQENAKAAEEQAQADKVAAQAKKEADKAAKESAATKREEVKAAKEAATATKAAAKEQAEAAKEGARAQTQAAKEAEKAERDHAAAARDSTQKMRDLQGGLQQVAMQLGVMSAALLYGAKTSIDAFNELRAAGQGLTTVAQRTGQDVGKVNEAAKTLSSDGLMTLQESSTSLKNLLATGFNLDQAINLINTFRDSAAFGRQSSLQFGEAVQTATEGVKNGNSILVDNAGITKNLSVILREAGKSEQDLQNVQSNTSVRMALYNGILKEGALFQGDAAKAAGELSGKMSATAASTKQLQATIGEGLAPAVAGLSDMIRPLINGLIEWIKANPDLARGLGIVVIATVTLGAALTGLAAAAAGLMTMLGPAGWLVLGISLAVGAIAGMTLAAKAEQAAEEQHQRTLVGLSDRYNQLTRAVDGGRLSAADRKRAEDELKTIIGQIGEIMPEIVTKWDNEGKAIAIGTTLLNANTEAARENIRVKMQKDAFEAAGDEAKARDELNKFLDTKGTKRAAQRSDFAGLGAYVNVDAVMESINTQDAKTEGELRKNLAKAAAAANQKAAAAGKWTPDERGRGNYQAPGSGSLFPSTVTGSGDGTGSGGKEMSAGLKAALEDLQDIQALEHTPENMARILAKTREIIAKHYDELAKLDKLRDMQRTAQITLPNEIAQAEYNQALSLLDADKQLKNLKPEAFAAQLRTIRDRFSAYLQAHPDQALQMDLRLKGATDEELKAPLDRWKEAMRTAEQAGGFDGTGGQDRKRRFLQTGLSLAIGANDQQAVNEYTGQIKQIEKALSDANFADRFDRIKKAREQEFTGAAGALAELQKQLITEEARGDKSDPVRISRLKEEMLNILTPALEDEQAALEALRTAVLADTTLSEEERAKRVAQIEVSLNGVRQDLYTQDVDVHRIATEAKVTAEKRAADEKKKAEKKLADDRKEAQKDALQELDKAEKRALAEFKQGAKAREDALQDEIKLKEQQLQQFDRQIAAEDRLKKITDAKKRIADLDKTGEREQVLTGVDAQGKPIYETRIKGMDEAKKALADAERDDERARQKETLQDQITNLRDQLQAEKDSNRDKEQSLKDHFGAMKDAMQTAFEEMNAEQATGLEGMRTSLAGQVDALLGEWSRYATEAKRIINSIPTALPDTPSSGGGGAGASPDEYRVPGSKHRAFSTGVYKPPYSSELAVVGDGSDGETILPDRYVPRLARLIGAQIAPPTIPVGIGGGSGGGGGLTVQNLNLSLPAVTDAAGFARELPGALQRAGASVETIKNVQIGIGQGRASG